MSHTSPFRNYMEQTKTTTTKKDNIYKYKRLTGRQIKLLFSIYLFLAARIMLSVFPSINENYIICIYIFVIPIPL